MMLCTAFRMGAGQSTCDTGGYCKKISGHRILTEQLAVGTARVASLTAGYVATLEVLMDPDIYGCQRQRQKYTTTDIQNGWLFRC
jgi:hypothetical protein